MRTSSATVRRTHACGSCGVATRTTSAVVKKHFDIVAYSQNEPHQEGAREKRTRVLGARGTKNTTRHRAGAPNQIVIEASFRGARAILGVPLDIKRCAEELEGRP